MAGKEEAATKKEIEEDTEEFLLERDNEGLYLGKERFLLDEEKDSEDSRFFGKKKNIIMAIVGYLIILAISGVIAYSIFKEISTALIVVGGRLRIIFHMNTVLWRSRCRSKLLVTIRSLGIRWNSTRRRIFAGC